MGRHARDGERPSAPTPRVALVLTIAVSTAWVSAFIIEAFSPTFDAPASLDPVMILVVSYYFGKVAVETRRQEVEDTPARNNGEGSSA